VVNDPMRVPLLGASGAAENDLILHVWTEEQKSVNWARKEYLLLYRLSSNGKPGRYRLAGAAELPFTRPLRCGFLSGKGRTKPLPGFSGPLQKTRKADARSLDFYVLQEKGTWPLLTIKVTVTVVNENDGSTFTASNVSVGVGG
jgi:hypothetical protein